jgi:hypothetical protein
MLFCSTPAGWAWRQAVRRPDVNDLGISRTV